MSWYRLIDRRLGSVLELSLLILLTFSLVCLFSEQSFSPGQAWASRPALRQMIPPCLGDADLDGQRDVRDLVLIQSHILGDRALTGEALRNADVGQDSVVDVQDLVQLLLHNLGRSELPSCGGALSEEALRIRLISPTMGPEKGNFTLVGRGFSSDPGKNMVLFYRPEAMIQAEVSSASETVIMGTVPESLGGRLVFSPPVLYAVTVTVDGEQSNSVGYEVRSSAPTLEVLPSSATVLLSPGSGEDVFLVAGGIPPYRLRPLSAQDQRIAVAELKDTFIEVIGLKEGSIELEVEDSANFPTTETVTVNVKEPVFNAVFDITPHTLLAGSSPAFTIKIRQAGEHMRLLRSEFRVEKASTDFSSLEEGGILGIQKQSGGLTPEFHYLQVSSIDATEGLSFHVQRVVDGSLAVSAEGSLGKGSAVMTLRPVPEPPAEGVVRSNMETEIVLSDQVIRLPDAPGETFDVIATLTSTTVLEGHQLPFTKTVTRSFTTVTPTSGAPRVERLLPFHGEMGHKVEIVGSDFDPVPENNQVTFQGSDNTRVEAPVLAASAQELLVYVPEGAVTGAVRVAINNKQSNDFLFRVLFQPDAGIFFAAGDVIEAETVPGETQGDGLNLPTQQSPGTLAPVILLAQEPDEVPFASLLVFVDGGSLNSADLEENASAGTASLVNNSTGKETLFQLFYGGQQEAESGIGKHFFDLKQEVGGSTQATLLVSEESEGTGVVFEMTSSGLSVLDSSLLIRFEKRIYLLPETMDTPIKMTIEVRSAQWNFFRGSEMVVLVEEKFIGP